MFAHSFKAPPPPQALMQPFQALMKYLRKRKGQGD